MRKHYEAKPCIIMDNAVVNSTWPEKVVVLAGNKSTTASILSVPRLRPLQSDCIILNHSAAKKLMLPNNYSLRFQIVHHLPFTIRLGPLVGVLTTVPLDRRHGLPVSKEARLFEEMFMLASRLGILMYLFYAHDIDWKSATVKGYTLCKREINEFRWINQVLPLPNIVYNRIRYRRIEDMSTIQLTLKKLANHRDIHLFNSRFLNKWEVYEALNSDSVISEFLPITKPYSPKNLSVLTGNYSEVFLKPRNSSVGKGIIKLIKQADGNFQYQLVGNDHKLLVRNSTGKGLYNKLKQYIENPQDYLVQQGIDLARLNNNVFDLRTLVQKDRRGNWRLVGVGARVAANKSFLTHIPNGGQTASYQQIMTYVFGNSPSIEKIFKDQMHTILRYVPKCLERELNLTLAVLSIDIGIDSTGKIWIIEVNSKPASFDEDAIRNKHLQYFYDYCLFLTGKKQIKEEHI
ncbi:MAG: YheC/YheD family protein [Syntrophomonas sp.]